MVTADITATNKYMHTHIQCRWKDTWDLTNQLVDVGVFLLKSWIQWAVNPSRVNFHSEQPGQQKKPENWKKGRKRKFNHQLPALFRCKCMYCQACLSLGHCSQSQKGRVPPIGAQPESSLLHHLLSSLPPPTATLALTSYTLTHHMLLHAHREITVWAHTVATRTQAGCTQMLMHALIYAEWQHVDSRQCRNWQTFTTQQITKCITDTVNLIWTISVRVMVHSWVK